MIVIVPVHKVSASSSNITYLNLFIWIQDMVTSIKTMTVMFADVAGSTTLYEKLGDEQANRIIYDVILMM